MFVAEGLVYLELQKTGGTHIRSLLSQFTDGKPVGKHNRLPMEYSSHYVFGSIRNPWDWYVSLWAYGVGGKGAVRARCVRRIDLGYYHRQLPKAMGKNWLTPSEFLLSLYHDAIKPVSRWHDTYDNSTDPELFRAWLKMLLDKSRRFDIGEGYGFSPLSQHAGLLTYRYLRLFTLGDRIYGDRRLQEIEGVSDFDSEFNISRGMIRTESLEEDFIRVIDEAGYDLSENQLAAIRSKASDKTNVSERKSAAFYYDDETSELVAQRDRYLVEKYGYQAPV